MNYRHIFHAGNFADVFKHIILVALTKAFFRKDTAFCYLDTHAGVGSYDLSSGPAQKGKEYENGIRKILSAKNVPELVQDYLSLLPDRKSRLYPGSPEIVRQLIRQQDRMVLSELHPDDYVTLKKHFAHNKQIAVHHQDAYLSLKAFLPPKEKRGLILIDPPYEQADEFAQLTTSLQEALKRFESGVYAIWYPIKHRPPIDRFYHQLKLKIERPMLACELSIYPDNQATQLNGCGMLIINPPFQLDQQLTPVVAWLWKQLSINQQGQSFVRLIN